MYIEFILKILILNAKKTGTVHLFESFIMYLYKIILLAVGVDKDSKPF